MVSFTAAVFNCIISESNIITEKVEKNCMYLFKFIDRNNYIFHKYNYCI